MITSVNAKISEKYAALFEEASDILKGFKKCHYYKPDYDFYYKSYAEDGTITFIALSDIDDVTSFSEKYNEYKVLYRALTSTEKDKIDNDQYHEGNEKTEITSLEEYYSWIKTLGGFDIKYLRLPLDEEPFYINTNTRAINIPSLFRSNGIAVQGDNLAETIYFTVDRYFDDKDLNDTNIWILWEGPQNKKGIVYDTLVKDIESEPGKIIFGWPIDKTITETPGTLKFSIKFLDDEGNYALSTLTASVNIKTSLNIDPENKDVIKIENLQELLLDRINNSAVIGTQIAQEPVFEIDLNQYLESRYSNMHDLDTTTSDVYDVDLIDGTLTLGVQAKSTDAGLIDYSWLYSKNNKNNGSAISSVYEYKAIEKTKLDDNQRYFYKNNDEKYYLYNGVPSEATITLYTRISTCTINNAGYYWAIAKNRIQHSTKNKTSMLCYVPFPVTPVIETNIIPVKILGDNEQIKVLAKGSKTDIISYQWQKINADGGWVNLIDNIDAEIDVDTTGRYRVIVTSARNNAKSTEVISDICRVVEPAQAFTIRAIGNTTFDDSSLSNKNCPTIELTNSPESDSYIVTWNKVTDFILENGVSKPSAYKPLESVESTVTELKGLVFNPKDYTKKLAEINEELTGYYLVTVTNKLGKEDNTKDSEAILFDII